MDTKRRSILAAVAVGGVGWTLSVRAQAEVDEKDPASVALGYVSNAANADAKKYPKYVAGQACASCALFQGKSGGPMGNCPLFGGKQVRAEAWCSAWAKRA